MNEVFLSILLICVLRLIYTDIKYRIIENKVIFVILSVCVIKSVLGQYIYETSYFAFVLIVFLLFIYYLKLIGGGDVKLVFAFLWGLNDDALFFSLILMLIIGAIQSLIMYVLKFARYTNESTLPYGVPIGVGFYLGHMSL
ncbi:prepilin peptidase [Vibrio mediterranei]